MFQLRTDINNVFNHPNLSNPDLNFSSADFGLIKTKTGGGRTMQVQLNAYRFVVLYRVPAAAGIDVAGLEARFGRWRTGAAHVGWQIGWRDAADPFEAETRYVEVYAYAMLQEDFLWNKLHQLYWRTDIVQMTRAFMLEARRFNVKLATPDSAAPSLRSAAPPSPTRPAAGR